MGICFDTERKQDEENDDDIELGVWTTGTSRNFRFSATSQEGNFPAKNSAAITFNPPLVPVIFVLGGPGSGKVTHCDNLSEEKTGVVHINVADLLQQYVNGHGDGYDLSQLSSKTVCEVLMLEMKMSPAATTYLVSGYPSSMRDVVEYAQKIKSIHGVILVSWRETVLERQIEYGAQLGHIVLSLARLELAHFFKNVTPVADYFDQKGLLIVVNGERSPVVVYNDFRAAVLKIISAYHSSHHGDQIVSSNSNLNNIDQNLTKTTVATIHQIPFKRKPDVIFVVGGPGSNKSELCEKVIEKLTDWQHFSLGRTLRSRAKLNHDGSHLLRNVISSGEMVNDELVKECVRQFMMTKAAGLIIDGYPRTVEQLQYFQQTYIQRTHVILLDCSKLQLGRGRWDDTIAAFKKRLQIFRELTLPMLRELDVSKSLTMIDGDTDTPEVERKFMDAVTRLVDVYRLDKKAPMRHYNNNDRNSATAIIEDLEEQPERVIPTNFDSSNHE